MKTTVICQGAISHRPDYAETDNHHVHPKYLAALLGLPVDNHLIVPLCSGCHDLTHHILHHFINEGNAGGHHMPKGIKLLVGDAWGWWTSNLK